MNNRRTREILTIIVFIYLGSTIDVLRYVEIIEKHFSDKKLYDKSDTELIKSIGESLAWRLKRELSALINHANAIN